MTETEFERAGEGDELPELQPVREDERFDAERVAGHLKTRLEGADQALEVEQFGGGHANLTYLLRFGEGASAREYVMRRPPLGPVAKGSHDMKREYRALSVLYRAFAPAPRAFLLCEDPSVIGAEFIVMERRHGVVVRGGVPAVFGGGSDPEANRKLSEVVIDTLVDLHAVDARAIGLDALGRPEGFLRRQVEGWAARYERARTGAFALADELGAWLLASMPDSPAWTLLHNDWKLDNMALARDDPGHCVAVYDWDMCTVGDPLCDLGTLMASWIERDEASGPLTLAMPTQSPGFMTRSAAIARYGGRSGRDLADMAYYQVFGTYKMAVVLQQIYFRFARGQTRDARFAGMEGAARKLFERAARLRP